MKTKCPDVNIFFTAMALIKNAGRKFLVQSRDFYSLFTKRFQDFWLVLRNEKFLKNPYHQKYRTSQKTYLKNP